VRIEEEMNPATNLHLLVIVNEPDIWMINRVDSVAQHFVDNGPTFNAHVPVLEEPGLRDLELGREVAYMKENRSQREGPSRCDQASCWRYSLATGGNRIVLLTDVMNDRPKELTISTAQGRTFKLLYEEYEIDLPVLPDLFRLPNGVKVVERP
jgi:hypothetical protein